MKKLELIEKYLNEELNANERSEFEQLQNSDADFAEEVQMAVAVNADFNVRQKMRWKSLAAGQGVKKETPIRQLTPRNSSFGWIRTIAAVSILGLGLALGWMMFSSPDLDALADEQLIELYDSPAAFMEKEKDMNWKNAITAYKEGNFTVTVAAIELSIKKFPEKLAEKHFYLGYSYLNEDVPNLDKAIQHLEKSKSLNATSFAQQANWFLSLAHLKKGNKKEAEALLQQMIDTNGWKKAEATALLNKL